MTPIRTFFSLSKAIRLKSFLKANDVLRLSEEQWVKGGETWLPDPQKKIKYLKKIPLCNTADTPAEKCVLLSVVSKIVFEVGDIRIWTDILSTI